MAEFVPCGLGVCAAEDGHEGTCEEASGWAQCAAVDEHGSRCIFEPGHEIGDPNYPAIPHHFIPASHDAVPEGER